MQMFLDDLVYLRVGRPPIEKGVFKWQQLTYIGCFLWGSRKTPSALAYRRRGLLPIDNRKGCSNGNDGLLLVAFSEKAGKCIGSSDLVYLRIGRPPIDQWNGVFNRQRLTYMVAFSREVGRRLGSRCPRDRRIGLLPIDQSKGNSTGNDGVISVAFWESGKCLGSR